VLTLDALTYALHVAFERALAEVDDTLLAPGLDALLSPRAGGAQLERPPGHASSVDTCIISVSKMSPRTRSTPGGTRGLAWRSLRESNAETSSRCDERQAPTPTWAFALSTVRFPAPPPFEPFLGVSSPASRIFAKPLRNSARVADEPGSR